MGIFDKIFKKVEKKEPRALRRMSLDDVDTWVKETSREIQEGLASEMQPAVDEILQFKEEACEIVEEIRDYKPPPEIKKRMFKPVLTAKPKYVKGMLDGLGNIRPISNDTYEALVDFNARAVKALKIIHRTQLNQGHIIATFFQKEIPRLGTALNRIIDLQKSIEEGIEEREKRGERTTSINTAVTELREAIEASKRLKDEAKKAKKEIEAPEAKLAKYEEELERLRTGAKYQKLADIESELANVQEKLAAAESRGRTLLGPLIRVLRKYARAVMDKGTKRVTESYIKNPQRSLFESADGAAAITRILNEVCAMADRGELSIDKKEREKVENAVDNLGGIKEEHTAIKKEEHRLKEALASSDIKNEEAAITAKLKNTKEDIKKLKTEAESAKAGAKEKKKEIKRLRKQLEKDVFDERGTEVTIEI